MKPTYDPILGKLRKSEVGEKELKLQIHEDSTGEIIVEELDNLDIIHITNKSIDAIVNRIRTYNATIILTKSESNEDGEEIEDTFIKPGIVSTATTPFLSTFYLNISILDLNLSYLGIYDQETQTFTNWTKKLIGLNPDFLPIEVELHKNNNNFYVSQLDGADAISADDLRKLSVSIDGESVQPFIPKYCGLRISVYETNEEDESQEYLKYSIFSTGIQTFHQLQDNSLTQIITPIVQSGLNDEERIELTTMSFIRSLSLVEGAWSEWHCQTLFPQRSKNIGVVRNLEIHSIGKVGKSYSPTFSVYEGENEEDFSLNEFNRGYTCVSIIYTPLKNTSTTPGQENYVEDTPVNLVGWLSCNFNEDDELYYQKVEAIDGIGGKIYLRTGSLNENSDIEWNDWYTEDYLAIETIQTQLSTHKNDVHAHPIILDVAFKAKYARDDTEHTDNDIAEIRFLRNPINDYQSNLTGLFLIRAQQFSPDTELRDITELTVPTHWGTLNFSISILLPIAAYLCLNTVGNNFLGMEDYPAIPASGEGITRRYYKYTGSSPFSSLPTTGWEHITNPVHDDNPII